MIPLFSPPPFPGNRSSYPLTEDGLNKFIADFSKFHRDQFELFSKHWHLMMEAELQIAEANLESNIATIVAQARQSDLQMAQGIPQITLPNT